MNIRLATPTDYDQILAILQPVFAAGETYAVNRDMTPQETKAYWFSPDKRTFLAEENGNVLGTYYLRPNQAGGGSHVCNCGYVTNEHARGRGIARAMCLHSLDVARSEGFRAMQFNCVVSTNVGAVALWQKLGFKIVGTLPGAFSHPAHGYVDAFVMFQTLAD